jgi:nicotinate-nucleotide--dimethylbenzimidazole phosphoribosyltransferase
MTPADRPVDRPADRQRQLDELIARIRGADRQAEQSARDWQDRLTKPRGALGVLEDVSVRLAGIAGAVPPPVPAPAAVAVFAADTGVHAQHVTPWPQEVTAQMVATFLAGGAAVNVLAGQVAAQVTVVDVGIATPVPEALASRPEALAPPPAASSGRLRSHVIRAGSRDFTVEPALTRDEALGAMLVGSQVTAELIRDGARCLLPGDMGIANTTPSAALISVFTGRDPAEVTGRGTGLDDATLDRKVEVVRRGLDLHQPDAADPVGVLTAVGGLEHAALTGFLLGAAAARVPVILDGVTTGAAALVAARLAPAARDYWLAGHRSVEPGATATLDALSLRPMLELDLRLGEGTGALLALPLVQAAARILGEMATFDAAGVTEKA